MSDIISGIIDGKVINYNGGVLFNVKSFNDYYYCFYQQENFRLFNKDMVILYGEDSKMIINGNNTDLYRCDSITVKCKYDLIIFLSNYFKTFTQDQLDDMVIAIEDYSKKFNVNSIDLLSELAENCVKNIKRDDMIDFADAILLNYDDEKKINIIEGFLKYYYSEYLFRALELIGIPKEVIYKIKIPLIQAIKICHVNPLRIAEIPVDIANRIFQVHLNEKPSDEQKICGNISRLVLTKLEKQNYTSVPLSFIEKKYPNISEYMKLLIDEYFVKLNTDSLYIPYVLKCEDFICNKIQSLLKKPLNVIHDIVYPKEHVTDEQDLAIRNSLINNISIIAGFAGTGKSTITEHIIRNCIRNEKVAIAVAFTGKATSRIKEILSKTNLIEQCEIYTIDLAIRKSSSITFDYVIIDEISMVTTELFYRFINAFRKINFSIIMIGDVNQLQPINYGNLLKQLLKTGIPFYQLTKNFRSEKTILSVCTDLISTERINQSKFVNWNQNSSSNDYQFHIGGIERILDAFNKFKIEFLKTKNENDFIEKRKSLTVITPYNAVSKNLNELFQSYFMIGNFTVIDNRKWFIGDRTILKTNNYLINVMNGETGYTREIYKDYIVVCFRNEESTTLPFFSKEIYNKLLHIKKNFDNANDEDKKLYTMLVDKFKFFEMTLDAKNSHMILNEANLLHAYCLTVHLAQGSEYENVIVYLPNRNSNFITVNLLYTAISRARKHLTFITENMETLNACSLRSIPYTSENLALKINNKCESLVNYVKKNEVCETFDEYLECGDDFDNFNFADFD